MEKLIINCIEDNKFIQDRKIIHSCRSEFVLEIEKIFYVEGIGYFDDIIGQYYTICPNCGYIVLLDETKIPKELKIAALTSKQEDPYEYKKNELRSELIHLENMTHKAKVRTL